MKPTRGLPNLWPGGLSQERRMALTATVLLFVLLGGMAVYQQITLRNQAAPESPGAVDQPPVNSAAAPAESAAVESPTAEAPTGPSPLEDTEPAEPAAAQRPDRLSSPLSGSPLIVKAYGSLDQAYSDYRLYGAVAYAAKLEQPVMAAAKGKVVALEEDPVEGTTLVLDHGGGMLSRYAGLGQLLVDLDAEVEAGETIAEVGPPGPLRSALGSHLAFAVWVDDAPVDPVLYLKD